MIAIMRNAGIAVLLLAGAAEGADAPPDGTYEYIVDHEILGEVGLHKYTFARRGDELIVSTKIRLAAKVLFVVVRRYTADRREVWRKGKLVSYDSVTDDDGKIMKVKARAAAGKLVIEGPGGRVERPGQALPAFIWTRDYVRQSLAMHAETGALKKIRGADAGEETIEIGRRKIKARKYVVSGGMKREVWYDQKGLWVKLRYVRDGDEIVVTLKPKGAAAVVEEDEEGTQ